MAYWLVKSEPFKYSWTQFEKDKKTVWDGVRNYQARNNLRAMRKGDLVFFYHSNEGQDIVGICQVIKEAYPDPSAPDGNWSVVDLAPVEKLKFSVTLQALKQHPELTQLAFIKQPRLSVSPVTDNEWHIIKKMSLIKT